MAIVSASVYSADLTQLRTSVEQAQRDGAGSFHVDVIDGHFASGLGFNARFTEDLRRCTQLPIDIHLQTQKPGAYIDEFVRAGADSIVFHIEEAFDSAVDLIRQIQSHGVHGGVALCPDTPVSRLRECLPFCDNVLLLGVRPGNTGEKFMPITLERIKELHDMSAGTGRDIEISVDGEIQAQSGRFCIEAGADKLVIGKAFFYSNNAKALVDTLTRTDITKWSK